MVYIAPEVVFVLYRGDEPIGVGSAAELEAALGVPERMIRYYATPSARKRATRDSMTAVRLKLSEIVNE